MATTSSAHPPPDPFFYKSLGTKDFRAEYDPETDPSPLKKGKEVVYRYDGEGVEAVEDPRRASSSQAAAKLKVVRENASKPLSVIAYAVSSLGCHLRGSKRRCEARIYSAC